MYTRPTLLPEATLLPRTYVAISYLCIAEPVRTGEPQPTRNSILLLQIARVNISLTALNVGWITLLYALFITLGFPSLSLSLQ
jgi:hypothetical protein